MRYTIFLCVSLQVYAKDPRVIRSLFYLCTSHVTRGSAGTPTLLDPSLSGRGPDGPTLEAVVVEAQRVLRAPDADPAVRRAAALMLAAAGRSNDVARAQALESLAQMVDASDSLVSAAGAKSGRGKAPVVSSANWELQHSIFAGVRFSDAPAASTHLSGGCFIGVASPDPAGARHALALAAELALKDPTLVISELSGPVTEAADMYEAGGADAPREPGTAINLEDNFARMYLARTCAHVLHSDQSAGDVSRGGAPFWRMLCMLATRDSSDLVRFAALEALTGAVVTLGQASLAGGQAPGAREAAVLQQRRARAWRLLAANAAAEVIVPGVGPGGSAAGMKLMEVIGRLLLLALSKVESAARFTVAASVAVSLAESCLAAQAGTARQIASPDVDKVMTILARELGSLIESPLRPAQRCVCAEALLYLQAAGYPTTLTPAKLAQAGGHGASGTQGALLAAVLKCAKAKPKDATSFLAYASGVVGIAPSGIDLAHVTQLWDAAASGGKEGRSVALAAALEAMRSPPPPCTRPRAGASPADVVTAAKEDAGWNSFVAAAAWWLGENANVLCEEFAGRKVQPVEDAPNGMNGNVSESDEESPAPSGEPEAPFDDDDNDAAAPTQSLVAQQAVLDRHAGRNPALSAVISSLQDAALTSVWQLRAAAARALAKIAVRSGEPFRLQCYGILTACRLSGGRLQDALGLQSVAGPALAVLDRIYATQAKLEGLYAELGDDVEGWPPEIIASLARRNAALRLQVEQTVCSVPPERYALLGLKAVAVLAYAEEEGPAYAAFLEKSGGKEAVQAGTAATGPNLTAVKNREVEDILSFGGSEEASFKFLPEKETTAAAADRNKEIESMLSVTTTSAADAWAFSVPTGGRDAAAAAPSYNAFAEVPSPTKTASPRAFDREISIYGSGAPAEVPSPSPTLPSQPVADAPGTARVIGTGTMLHTFIADPNNPEELSIFEGDQVEVLEDSDGWLLVRDPSGSQGMVPTAYVHLERLFTGAGATGGQQGGGDVWASLARNTSALSSPTSPQRSLHARGCEWRCLAA